jgi:hypothetical protein
MQCVNLHIKNGELSNMLTLFGKGYQTKKIYGRKNQYFIIMLMHTKTKKTREMGNFSAKS